MQYSAGLLTIVSLVAVVLGIITWIRTKGSIMKALGVFLGAGIVAAFIVKPSLMTQTIPTLVGKVLTWFIGLFG